MASIKFILDVQPDNNNKIKNLAIYPIPDKIFNSDEVYVPKCLYLSDGDLEEEVSFLDKQIQKHFLDKNQYDIFSSDLHKSSFNEYLSFFDDYDSIEIWGHKFWNYYRPLLDILGFPNNVIEYSPNNAKVNFSIYDIYTLICLAKNKYDYEDYFARFDKDLLNISVSSDYPNSLLWCFMYKILFEDIFNYDDIILDLNE